MVCSEQAATGNNRFRYITKIKQRLDLFSSQNNYQAGTENFLLPGNHQK